MARSGNLADWQRQLAERRQEEAEQARERRQQQRDREKVRQQEHHDSRQQAADEQNAAVAEQLTSLDEVLTSALALAPMSFDRLMVTPRTPPFDPGPLGAAPPGPGWIDFAPDAPRGLSRFLGGGIRYKRQLAQAQGRFEAATAEFREQEVQRQRALAVATAKYHGALTEERGRAAARNAQVTRRQAAFAAGDAGAVAWFVRCVLKASRYADGFPRGYQVTYDAPASSLAVEFELPPQTVVPPVRAYRYVKARDIVEAVPRPDAEIRRRYERLISAIALRTMHEIFSATPAHVIQSVSFAGYVTTTDPATGKSVRPRLLAASADRAAFEDLVLADVDPAACLAGFGAPTAQDRALKAGR